MYESSTRLRCSAFSIGVSLGTLAASTASQAAGDETWICALDPNPDSSIHNTGGHE